MDNKNFVSRENVNNIYSFICSKIKNVDLNTDKNNKKIVRKLIKTIFSKHTDYTFDQLNRQAVEQILPFMENHVNGKNNPHPNSSNGNSSNGNSSNGNIQGINSMLSSLGNDYESSFSNNSVLNASSPGDEKMTNASFSDALDKKNKERSYDRFLNDSSKFRDNLEKAEKIQQEKITDLNERGLDNNFFKKLDTVNKPDDFSLAYSSRPDIFNMSNNNNSNDSNQLDRNLPQVANEIKVKVIDHSSANEVGSFDPSVKPPDLIEETYGGEAGLPIPNLYQNTRTGSERIKNSLIVLDTGTFNSENDGINTPKESLNTINEGIQTISVKNTGTNPWYKVRINLGNNFNIDKVSDVFLKRFTMIGPASPQNCQSFIFKIDELVNQSESNNNFIKNKFVIPNTTTQTLTRSSLTFNADAGTIGTTTAINVSADPRSTIYPGDDVYANNVFVGTVTATANASLTFGGGTKAAISSGDHIMFGTIDNLLNAGLGEDNYITTINPKVFTVFNITLTNQDGNHTDSSSGANNTFANEDSARNRFILELEFKNRDIDRNIDFVNPNSSSK
jgi:hypothetical protein